MKEATGYCLLGSLIEPNEIVIASDQNRLFSVLALGQLGARLTNLANHRKRRSEAVWQIASQ